MGIFSPHLTEYNYFRLLLLFVKLRYSWQITLLVSAIWHSIIFVHIAKRSSQHSSHRCNIFVVRTFKIYCQQISNLQHAIVNIHHVVHHVPIIYNSKFVRLTTFPHFTHSQPLPWATTNLFSVFMSLDSTYKWDHIVFVFWWFVSLGTVLSRSICLSQMATISFSYGWIIFHWIIFHCIYISQLLHPSIVYFYVL